MILFEIKFNFIEGIIFMANIVQYHNDLNSFQLSGISPKEMDIFYTFCFKLKNQGTKEVEFSYEDIKKIAHFSNRSDDRLEANIISLSKTLLGIIVNINTPEKYSLFTIFSKFEIYKEEKNVRVQINSNFEYLLNDFISNYTQFELEEMVSIKSGYAKTAYKLFKQFRNTGWYEGFLKDFIYILDVPETYGIGKITEKVLNPITKELSLYFKNLKLEKIKKGRNVEKIRYTWDVEKIQIVEKPKDRNKIIAIKAAIPTMKDKDIEVLLNAADTSDILEKYYTLAVGKEIENLTGFLLSAIKNDWKTASQAEKEFKKDPKEMDEFERKLQKRLYQRRENKEKSE